MTIENANYALAEARANQDLARAELEKATAHQERVKANVLALHAQRAELVARRSSGQETDDLITGSKLQIIALDLESLTDLQVQAEADVKAAQANVAGADVQVADITRRAQIAEDEAILARLIPNATILAERLLESITRMKAIHARLGQGRPDWKPSVELCQAIRFMEFNASRARR